MPEWKYRKIDLNLYRPQGDELDLLNAAGAEGWELVGITSNNMAYLKRELAEVAAAAHAGYQTRAEPTRPNGYHAGDGRTEVKVSIAIRSRTRHGRVVAGWRAGSRENKTLVRISRSTLFSVGRLLGL